jgi:hypothetical protein
MAVPRSRLVCQWNLDKLPWGHYLSRREGYCTRVPHFLPLSGTVRPSSLKDGNEAGGRTHQKLAIGRVVEILGRYHEPWMDVAPSRM